MNYNPGTMGIVAEPIDSSGAWITLWRYSEMRQRSCIFTGSSCVFGLALGKSCDLGIENVIHIDGPTSALSAADTLANREIGVFVLQG